MMKKELKAFGFITFIFLRKWISCITDGWIQSIFTLPRLTFRTFKLMLINTSKRWPPQVNGSHIICSCEKKRLCLIMFREKKLLKNPKAAFFFQKLNRRLRLDEYTSYKTGALRLFFIFHFFNVLFELKIPNPLTCFNSSSSKRSILFVQMF